LLGIVIQIKKEDTGRVKCSKPHGGKIWRGWGYNVWHWFGNPHLVS